MDGGSVLHYNVVSRAFTAMDIAQPLTIVPPDTPIVYDERGLGHPDGYPTGYWCWLVADEDRTYGYVTEQTLDEEHKAATMAELARFGAHDLVPGAMPLLEVIPRLARERGWTLLVLTEKGVTHYICGEELDSMPVKLCLFALLVELEVEMRHALLSQPDRLRERWGRLRPFRQESLLSSSDHGSMPQAQELSDERLRQALKHANLSDHEDMLFGEPGMITQYGFATQPEADAFFHRARQVRNVVAHGSPLADADEELMVPRKFASFMAEVQRVLAGFVEQRRAGGFGDEAGVARVPRDAVRYQRLG